MHERIAKSGATLAVLAILLVTGVRPAAADPAIYEVGDDPSVGFNLISWSSGATATTFQNAVQAIHDAGFREVSIAPVQFFNTTTFAIAPNSSSPSLTAIDAGVAKAKQLGMRVTLNPFVEPQNFVNWRGTYNPSGAAATQFWSDYQNYVVAVANIAQAHGAEAMTVGTELKALDDDANNASHWNDVINAVASVYHGQIGYASNWDDYNNATVTNSIWENPHVNFIGIDSYFNNDNGPLFGYLKHQNPGMSNGQIRTLVTNAISAVQTFPDQSFTDLMTAAWNYKLDNEILPFAAARKNGAGMPVEFTEQGYTYYNTTTRYPQVDPSNTAGVATDTAEQRMAYQGLINALDHRGNKFEAVDIWNWGISGTGTNEWDMGLVADSGGNGNSGADANNVPLTQLLSNFSLAAVTPLAGDYNRDGVVDSNDYVVWQNTFGKYVADFNGADGNGDGQVDAADYTVWRDHFAGGIAGGGALSAVPEPGALSLAVLGIIIGAHLGWRGRASGSSV